MGVIIISAANELIERNGEIAFFKTPYVASEYAKKKGIVYYELHQISREEYFALVCIQNELGSEIAFKALQRFQDSLGTDEYNQMQQMLKEFNAAYTWRTAYSEMGCHFQDEVLTHLGLIQKGEYIAAYMSDTSPNTFTAKYETERPKLENMISEIRQSLKMLEADFK